MPITYITTNLGCGSDGGKSTRTEDGTIMLSHHEGGGISL